MALGFIGDIIGDIARSLYGSLPPEISSLYKDDLPQVESPDITFQPFTVTGPGGSQVRTTADGSTSYALSPEQQAMQQQLFGGAQSMFQGAMGPTADREAAIYDRMRAAQMPEEARQRAALEERLAAQGRLGVRTNQFGGTPEQLAMAKAQAEAQNTAGGQFLQQSYAPQAALLSMMSPALNVAGLSDVARRQQGEFDLETAMANLQGEMGQRAGLANLYGGLFSGAAGMAGGFGQGLLDILGF
jgi:hypothetical protein